MKDGDRSIELRPGRQLRVDYSVDYAHPLIGCQEIRQFTVTAESFEQEICRARTFGFLHEVEALWKLGLARGGNLDNTVVLDKERVLNRDGLRWRDEFVRHKVLDLVGDLALLGIPLEADVSVSKGGHALHQMLLQQLLETPDAWELVGESRSAGSRAYDHLVTDESIRATA